MKNLVCISLLSFLVLSSLVQAQDWVQGGPWNGYSRSITVNPHDTTNVFTVADNRLWISNDSGQNFEMMIDDFEIAHYQKINGPFFHPQDTEALLFSIDSSIFSSNDGGLNWTELNSDFINGTINEIISLPGEDGILLLTDYSSEENILFIQRSEDFGQSWTTTDSLINANIITVLISYDRSNPDHLVYFYDSGETDIFRESNDAGLTWETTRSQTISAYEISLLAVDPQNPEHYILSGIDMDYHRIFAHSFANQEEFVFDNHSAIHGLFQNTVGDIFFIKKYHLQVSHDGCLTWNTINDNFPNKYSLDPELFCKLSMTDNPCNPNSMFFSNNHGMFYSQNQGSDIGVVGKGIQYAENIGFKEHNGELYANSGESGLWKLNTETYAWENLTPHQIFDFDIAGTEENYIFIAGCRFFRSLNNGLTFNYYTTPPGIIWYVLATESVIITGDMMGWIQSSSDLGATWNDLGFYGNFFKNKEGDTEVIYRCDSEGIKKSYDNGDSWVILNADISFKEMTFTTNPGEFYASTNNEELYYSNDDAATVTRIDFELPENIVFKPVVQPGNFGQRVFVTALDSILYSDDHGENWQIFEDDHPVQVVDIAFSPDGTDMFLSTIESGIWYCQDLFNDLREPDEIFQPSDFGIQKVYPNPFNSSVRISYSIDKPMNILIQIYNIYGQLVDTIFKGEAQAGKTTISWDGSVDSINSKIASGIFFVKLNTPEGNSVQKIIMIK